MVKLVNYSMQPNMGNQTEVIRPFQRLYIDFLGPYPRSRKGNCYILIILDHYSRFVLLKPLREASAALLCSYVENEVFNVFSVSQSVLTDNGQQFKAHLFSSLLAKYGVEHIKTPYHAPQSNASERVNRTLLAAVRAYVADNHSDWDSSLGEVASTCNVVHTSTGYSPNLLVFGQHYINHGSDYALQKLLNIGVDNELAISSTATRLSLVRDKVLENLKIAYKRHERVYNQKGNPRELTVGQQIYVRTFVQSDATKQFSAKFAPKFIPAVITGRVGNAAFHLSDPNGKYLGVYHQRDIRN